MAVGISLGSTSLGLAVAIPDSETESHSIGSADRLTGDWCGGRTQLEARGIEFSLDYTGEVFGNVSGGMSRSAIYAGLAEVALDLDLEKLTGWWRGGSLRVNSIFPHGNSLTEGPVGDAAGLSNIDAHDSLRLYELWIRQSLLEGRLTLQVGNLLADEDFAVNEQGGLFINSGFGWPHHISAAIGNTIPPAYFVSALGALIRYQPTSRWYFQAAVYDGDAFDSPEGDPRVNEDGLHWQLNHAQGAFIMAETGFHWALGPENHRLPGVVKLGGWLSTSDFEDLHQDEHGGSWVVSGLDPQIHAYGFGIFLSGEQRVWRESGPDGEDAQGLGVFFRAGGGPEDRDPFSLVMDGGVNYLGLLPGRDEDVAGLGFVYAGVSGDLRQSQRDDRDFNAADLAAISDYEAIIELTYLARITPWWSLQPDLQFILHPGASAATDDALVIGLRSSLSF